MSNEQILLVFAHTQVRLKDKLPNFLIQNATLYVSVGTDHENQTEILVPLGGVHTIYKVEPLALKASQGSGMLCSKRRSTNQTYRGWSATKLLRGFSKR